MPLTRLGRFIFSRIKKGEDQGKEKCHAKSMMSKETNERLKRDTQHVPLRQKTNMFRLYTAQVVYLQQIKKKRRKPRIKTCHAKTMLSLEKPIKLL